MSKNLKIGQNKIVDRSIYHKARLQSAAPETKSEENDRFSRHRFFQDQESMHKPYKLNFFTSLIFVCGSTRFEMSKLFTGFYSAHNEYRYTGNYQ